MEVFANHMSDKDLVPRVYKEHLQPNKKDKSIQKWAKKFNRLFFKEIIEMVDKHMKRY